MRLLQSLDVPNNPKQHTAACVNACEGIKGVACKFDSVLRERHRTCDLFVPITKRSYG
jgi:hypothetical protein